MDSESIRSQQWLTLTARAIVWLAVGGLSLGFALRVFTSEVELTDYFARNVVEMATRKSLLHWMCAGAVLSSCVGLGYLAVKPDDEQAPERLYNAARRLSPLYLAGFLPLLFHWQVWRNNDVTFLTLVGLCTFATWFTFRQLQATTPFAWESKVRESFVMAVAAVANRSPKLREKLPLYIVFGSTFAYIVYFSYYTLAFHHSVRSGYDLALENNLMWNLVHGGPFFKSSPLVGPVGTHFGYHATLFAFVMAPIYAIYPQVETLLVIQASLLGGAAIPLYFFARRHVGSSIACVLSVVFLLYPALHGANIFEFHYIPLGPIFLFSALAALDARRDIWAAIFVAITLTVREDVSAWVAVLGAYFLLSGRRPVAGVVLSAVGLAYFGLIKFVVMPRFATGGGESFTFIFEKLIPPGAKGFGGVLTTVVANPAYTLFTVLEVLKFVYVLQLLIPLAFIPLRYRLWKLLILPGFFFTLLSTDYSPTVSIHFQYSAHWIAFLFPATALALEELRRSAPTARLTLLAPVTAMILSTLAVSYQYGSILQKHTSFGGPIPYTFGVDDVGKKRRAAMDIIMGDLPADAKVSCSGFVTPQLSSRPDAYSMTLGIYDAEYIVFPTVASDFIGDERSKVTRLLQAGEFGLVSVHAPFALARRGAPTERNSAFLSSLR
jgi:uncharacterized membrane protein